MAIWRWRVQHGLALFLAALALGAAVQARAELMGDVAEFLQHYDQVVALRAQIARDRDALAADSNDHKLLKQDVERFFSDRKDVAVARLAKTDSRKQMRISLSFTAPKLEKPVKGTGVLAQDAANYVANYDAWVALQQQVELDIAAMRSAVNASDAAALTSATTAFFTDSRARHQKRLQWQQDLRAMRKDITFKGTGKPLPPPKGPLKVHVQEFLNDRAAWEAYGALLEVDRNNLRAAVQSGASLDAIALSFFTDRRARHVKGVELALDRKAMRADIGLSNGSAKESKQGALASSKNVDKDDEDTSLEETSDTSGEK